MSMRDVMRVQDSNGYPNINQPYVVEKTAEKTARCDVSVARPPPSCASNRSKQAVYSAWNWFIRFLELQRLQAGGSSSGRTSAQSAEADYGPAAVYNAMTGRPRLAVFRQLATCGTEVGANSRA